MPRRQVPSPGDHMAGLHRNAPAKRGRLHRPPCHSPALSGDAAMMHGSAPTAQLRVALPRVQPAPRARGAPQYDTRRAPTQQRQHYTVPLPAALFLLLLLAFVFHRQLKSIAGEADDLEASLIECQNARKSIESGAETTRRRYISLQAQVSAYRSVLTDEQLAAVDGAYPGLFDASPGRGPPFDWPQHDSRQQTQGRELAGDKQQPQELELSQEARDGAAAAVEAARRRGDGPIAAVVVMACNRPTYLRRMLTSLLAVHGGDPRFPMVTVSQDGTHVGTADAAREFVASHGSLFRLWQHPQSGSPKLLKKGDNPAYYRISAHYKWALDRLFKEEQQQRVIILEDDMVLAPDFFEYFAAMARVLDADPGGLWCASSWNDHGQAKFVGDAAAVYRSDFFPGLGWMLTAATWATLTDAWPVAFWDDWMRMNTTRKGRQCLRPEVCRTYNIGRLGASKGQFYSQFLAPVALNTQFVHWTAHNLSFLAHGGQYGELLAALVGAATPVDSAPAALSAAASGSAQRDLVFAYETPGQYTGFATGLGLMKDLKDGQPRGSYQGVVTVRLHGTARLFIAPAEYVHAARSSLVEAVQADWARVSGRNETGGTEEEQGAEGEATLEGRHAAPVTVGGSPGADAL